jgi:UDP-N-acetylmuramyl-tripeptide synthetase
MRLSALLSGTGGKLSGGDPEIAEVRDDSRQVGAGDLFVAVRGQTVDGHAFVAAAAEKGARAVVVERPVEFAGAQVIVPSAAKALGLIAANRFGRPAEALTMLGVTGTNGKTTTNFLAEAIARAAGGKPGVIGTVVYRWGDVSKPAPYTTPTPLELHATLAEMRAAGCTHAAMECSSHALALDRLEGVKFRVAAFTNLTQDHLDLHGTMEAYRDAKARLFAEHLDGTAVILMDHPYGEFMANAARGRVLRVATDGKADVAVVRWEGDVSGIRAEFATPVGKVELRSALIGRFNLENLAVAVGIGAALELAPEKISAALDGVRGVPGRMERVGSADVFVDYAHTPDALERVMAAARPLTKGRLIVVFGCGGDRDKTKRPIMGRAVAREADLPVVTSDNPRTEEPQSILDMITAGVREVRRDGFLVEIDRRKAIRLALAEACPGDVVVIAGKGHEDYQIVGKTKHHFDDREEAKSALEELARRGGNRQS